MEEKELLKRFTYHPPKRNQPERYEKIRAAALEFAKVIEYHCMESREKSLAITHVEESVFWANAAIARNEP